MSEQEPSVPARFLCFRCGVVLDSDAVYRNLYGILTFCDACAAEFRRMREVGGE